MLKSELARCAGVDRSTFYRWLKADTDQLTAMGVTKRQRLLPPQVVKFLATKYDIDV